MAGDASDGRLSQSGPPAPEERALYADGPEGRFLLERGWETRADPRDEGVRRGWQRPGRDSGFGAVSVPHSFNARGYSDRGFRSGIQWYRVRFRAPAGAADAWMLRFESVNRRARVWLNGRAIGGHEGAHLPFELDASGLRAGGVNELVVRVDGRLTRSDLPPGHRPQGWWNHGGILREVYLRRIEGFDIADVQIQAGMEGDALVRAVARNRSRLARPATFRAAVSGPDGREIAVATAESRGGEVAPGGLASFEIPLTVSSPRLWSPDSPALYELRLSQEDGPATTVHFGFREWGVDREGRATLNGRPLALRGASVHEQVPSRGQALRPADRDRIVRDLERVGADFTREHYAPHPALLEAFDREGIVFWEQVPVWRLRGSNLGASVRREALRRLRETVVRDRNHASVMAWSVANETLAGGGNERRYIADAASLARRLDPSRLVAADQSLRPVRDLPAFYSELDAIGLNEYVGWYGSSPTSELTGDLVEVRRRFPGEAIFVTEFGAEANRGGPASQKGTFAFQAAYVREHLELIGRSPANVSGALVWLLRDFAVRPGWSGGNPRPDPPFNRKGLLDERGRVKPAFEIARDAFGRVGPFR